MLREFIEQLDKLPQRALVNGVSVDAQKPLIGIISAANQLSSSHNNLDDIVKQVSDGIVSCGANVKVAYVPSVECNAMHGSHAAKYDLPNRDLVANSVELICSNDYFDALVFVASEQNVVAGMLLGAIRLNVPCAFVSQGTASPVRYDKKEHGYSLYFEQIARIKSGKTPYDMISELQSNLPLVSGTDCDSYGANSLNCLLEVAGLAPQGNGTAGAGTVERKKIAFEAGRLAARLFSDKLTPRRILSQAMLTNLCIFDLACGGSSTAQLNLVAIAKELGVRNINFKTIGDLGKCTPVLLSKENPNLCIMTQFHKAGGVYAMAQQLVEGKVIDGDVYVKEDCTLAQAVASVRNNNRNVIRAANNPVKDSAYLRAVSGNLAQEGAFVQYRNTEPVFVGTARVYNNEEMAIDAILHKEIREGNVVVIRAEGAKSGPGMREIYAAPALLSGFGLSDKVAIVTDGRIADIYDGMIVGHITPETSDSDYLTVIQDGDEVEINVLKGRISCNINAKELAQRVKNNTQSMQNYGNFYLKQWSKNCYNALEGCAVKKK